MAKTTGGLGKGLASLIPTDTAAMQTPETTMAPITQQGIEIPIELLSPNPFQPRKEIDEEALDGLVQSIKSHGILQPLLLRRQGDSYQIIAGERRYRAAQKIGLKTVPSRIIDLNDKEMREVALVENLQREDLSALEIAYSLVELIEQFTLTHDQVAERLGWSRAAVSNKLRLLQLPQEIISMIQAGDISEGHGRALLSLNNVKRIYDIAAKSIDEKWSVRNLEDYIRKVNIPNPDTSYIPVKQVKTLSYEFAEEFNVDINILGNDDNATLRVRNITRGEAHKILALINQNKSSLFPGK